jgi:3-methyl-2-oxobutanoate hydroxymethyltransferase
MKSSRISPAQIKAMKGEKKIVALTCYAASFAPILDEHCDMLLIGDSVAMVIYGRPNTLDISLDTIMGHAKAVVNSTKKPCVMIDMPFGSYQKSKEQAFENAARALAETGASCIKMEVCPAMVDTVKFLVDRGIPVCAHIGFMLQYIHVAKGFRYQGRTQNERDAALKIALELEQAGAFSLLLEVMEKSLAEEITQKVSIPTIGIGASPMCDGQILVTEDMAGLNPNFSPKFLKRFGNMHAELEKAVTGYASAVRDGSYPGPENCYIGKD